MRQLIFEDGVTNWMLLKKDDFVYRIMSWYRTYVRTLGRGFTLDDPDTIAWLATTISSIIYLVYNIQINVDPEQYGTNMLYHLW